MNRPAKAVVAIALLAAVIWVGRQANQAEASSSPSAPAHQARVIAFTCDPNLGRPRADISIQNVGQTTIEFPQATVQFGSGTNTGYLQPNPLRPGGIASDSIYSPVKAASGCVLLSVQDRDGYSVSLK